MPIPDLLRQDVDEADAVIDRALDDVVGGEEAVDVVGAQVRDHLGRRHGAELHVGVGVDAVLGEVVAQKIIVVRVIERDRELEALPVLRIAVVFVLVGETDRLTVDVLDGRNREGHRVRAEAKGDGERHRRQHVGGVVFLVQRLVAHHRPAGGLHHLNVQALLLVEAHGLGHDDRRSAGDRDEADLEVGLLGLGLLGEGFGDELRRQELADNRRRGRGPDTPQDGAAFERTRKQGAHHRRRDGPLDRRVPRRQGRLVRSLAIMRPAGAAAAGKAAFDIERIVEGGHHGLRRGRWKSLSNSRAKRWDILSV
ncbi:hypothetical protein MET9862_03444 [Methylobacterium symbioticum]|uniref:Uncharacterized protein n=1 Tax=Methylobacterium symbioticum TaxID=2584084 RepID=A0A509EHB2_9HYPH|nr:hypothetical protein MET9862_03444 [Methylobacterium symbioticum]